MDSVGGAFDSRPSTAGQAFTVGGKRGNTTFGVTLAAAPAGNLSYAAADESDPYALLYNTPAHQPPSLARRIHGTETLFNYYAQRGHKEVLNEAATLEVARAVQTCLDAGAEDDTAGFVSPVSARRQLNGAKAALGTAAHAQTRRTQAIDRCLAGVAASLPPVSGLPSAATAAPPSSGSAAPFLPLRPAEANDSDSVYRTQRAEEARLAAEADRRERLRHMPEAAIYLGRYYPEGTHVVQDVQAQLAELRASPPPNASDTAGTGGGAGSGRKMGGGGVNSNPSSISVAAGATLRGSTLPPTAGAGSRALSNSLSATRAGAGAKKVGSLSSPSLAPLYVPTPEEARMQLQSQQEGRHCLADQLEDAFVAAYHLRDPAAAQRQRDREAAAAQRRSTATAAAMLAGARNSSAAKRRGTSAASRKSGGRKKNKSTAPPAPAKREVGIAANLELFRTSLLLVCNEEGAVTLDQLRTLLADVPFHVGSTNAVFAGSDAARSVQRLFQMVHLTTRAPNAADATDLLLAVANATAGGPLSRPTNQGPENSFSGAAHSMNNAGSSFSRASNVNMNHSLSNAARRGPGSSMTQAGPGTSRAHAPSVSAQLRASSPSVVTPLTPTSGAPNIATPPPGASLAPTWNDVPSTAPQSRTHAHKSVEELYDGRKCVLVVEVLDALDALLNSPTTQRVVRWECFSVLASEGNGYILKSQLAKLRRLAYRDGSAAEEQAAVTAAMVKALNDVFTVVAAEEEAAYLKANKKGKKKAGAPVLAAHQSSPIPLNVMRKSHIDYATFSRFFDELPLLAAAYAHVWLPMLVSGRRHGAAAAAAGNAGGTAGAAASARQSAVSALASPVSNGPTLVEVAVPSDYDAEDGSDMVSSGRRAQSQVNAVPSREEDDPNVQPLELLGATTDARQATVQWLVAERQEQLRQACDALEKERLLAMHGDSSNGAFAEAQSTSRPVSPPDA